MTRLRNSSRKPPVLPFALIVLVIAGAAATGAETPKAEAPPGMALIPAGEFTMGRTRETSDDKTGMRPLILRDDIPARKVTLDAFYLDTHEVTHAAYARFVAQTKHRVPYHWLNGVMPRDKAKLPLYNVDWADASAYCAWDGKRLPTEAEWEKAARGGIEGADFPNGDKLAEPDARFNTPEGPVPVGSYKPNAYGLFDIPGNVAEWCADWFARTYYQEGPARNPKGPEAGTHRVIRGGAWSDGPRRVTVFFRNWVRPNQTTPNIGIRCAKDFAP